MPKEATFEERGIKIVILSPFVNGMTIKTAHTALRGLVELMAQYAEFGTRAGSISVIKFGSPLGAIELSGSETPAVGPSALTINSTVSMDRPTDVRAYALVPIPMMQRPHTLTWCHAGWILPSIVCLIPMLPFPSKVDLHTALHYLPIL